jgi:beta-glucosidase
VTRKLTIALALLASGAWAPLASAQTAAPGLLGDPSATPEQRARAAIERMTLEEKARQLGHTAPAIPRLGVPAI